MKSSLLLFTLSALLLSPSFHVSAQTPQLIKDIRAGSGAGSPREFVNLGSYTYFAADDDGANFGERWQLWCTNGTALGTVKIANLPGEVTWLTVAGSRLFFVVGEPFSGQALYVSDGTELGTQEVGGTNMGGTDLAEKLTALGSQLYFTDNGVLKTSDGTSIVTLPTISQPVYASTLVAGDGVVYFVPPFGASGTELWKTDGTALGTVVVKDIVPGSGGSNPQFLRFWNGKVYFQASNQIWRSDGTELGTERLDTSSALTSAGPFCPAGNDLYFGAVEGGARRLYRTNGGVGHVELLGTHPSLLLTNFSGFIPYPEGARELNGKIIFNGRNIDGFPSYTTALWAWDSVNGIVHLEDVDRWDDLYPNSARGWDHVFVAGRQMYFPSTSSFYGKTNGTSAGSSYNAFANFNWQLPGGGPSNTPPGNDAILRPEGILYGGFGSGIGTELYLFPTATPPTPQETWRQTHFGTTANSGDAADLFDFDKDGLVNLMEFALGSHPKAANAQPGSSERVGNTFEFIYNRATAAVSSGVQFIVEWNDALSGTWSTSGVSQTILSDNGTLQQVKAVVVLSGQSSRFVHLRVTAPD